MNNRKLILHIGMGKTGTTSIQYMLNKNSKQLKNNGYIYHVSNNVRPNHHILVSTPFDKNMWSRDGYKYAELKKFFDDSSASTMIISTEKLLGAPKYYIKRIKEVYSNVDIEVLVYIRNQIDSLPSIYLQRQKDLKTPYYYSIRKAFDKYKDSWGAQPDKIVNNWMEVFNKDSIRVRVFDRTLFEDNDVCNDFARLVGIDRYVDTNHAHLENISLLPHVSNLVSVIDQTFPELMGKQFPYRQKNVISCLLELTSKYSKNLDYVAPLEQLISNIVKFVKITENDPRKIDIIEKEVDKAYDLLRAGREVSLLDHSLHNKILEYYRDSNYRFSDIFLDDREAKVFLKHYSRR